MEQEQEKESFEALVKKASEVGDARTKAYNELQKKLEEVYIPQFQNAMSKCGKKYVKIITEIPLVRIKEDYSNGYRLQESNDDQYNEKYCLFIFSDGDIREGDFNLGPDVWEYKKQREITLCKSAVVYFANILKEKMSLLISNAESEKQAAENALNF